MSSFPLFIHAVTPLHVGGGEASAGVAQTIARNPVTGVPLVPGSGLKGVLRAVARTVWKESSEGSVTPEMVFGKGADAGSGYAGSLTFHDAALLAMPIRSAAGTFAWATSPYLLRLHARDCALFCPGTDTPEVPDIPSIDKALISPGNDTLSAGWGNGASRLVVEDLVVSHIPSPLVTEWWEYLSSHARIAGPNDVGLGSRFCVLHDEVMFFLAKYAVKIDARNSLGDGKTVTNFWHEEALPGESLLAGIATISCTPSSGVASSAAVYDAVNGLLNAPLQIGGNATVGRGVCRVVAGSFHS